MQLAQMAMKQAQQMLAQSDGSMPGMDGFGSNGMVPGKGKLILAGSGAGPEAGHGTTNQKQYGGLMGGHNIRNRQASERPDMRSRFERIYAPERVASNRIDTQVRGKRGQGSSDYSPVRGAPERSQAYQPYYQVYSSYRRAAEDALGKEDVPAAYKKQVRDYFESLGP